MTREEALRRLAQTYEGNAVSFLTPEAHYAEVFIRSLEELGLAPLWEKFSERRVPRFDATNTPHAVDTHEEQPSDPESLLRLFELERKECLPPHFASVTYLSMAQRDTLIAVLKLQVSEEDEDPYGDPG